ncbi:Phosphatidylinositol transfer protein (PITP) [Ciborinia camelliae]|nr:Phosphatidylinositol transfer protein (PITP) [Ciborinia camelliae]
MSAAPVTENQIEVTTIEKEMAGVNLGGVPDEKTPPAALGEKGSNLLKPPFLDPIESSKPPPPPELTEEQQKKYEALLETVKSWTEVPAKDSKGGPLTDSERIWLTRECLCRYLRATKWSATEAPKRLLGTLTWRREYGVSDLTGDDLSIENETGKQFILGYDNEGRPCHYLNPGRQNTEPSPKQVQHLVFMLERCIDLMIPGQWTLALLINFKSSKSRSNTAPGIGMAREVLNILQTHYPERLGRALIINIPWMVNGFFKLITPFIDPLTKEKLKFNDDMNQHVPPQQLWAEFNGELEYEYDHTTYWPTLLQICEERQNNVFERWVQAGKHIGESEIYLKGGNVPSIGGSGVEEVSSNGHAVEPKTLGTLSEISGGGASGEATKSDEA